MQPLRPTVKRDLSLFSIQSWQKGYTKYLKKNLDFWYDIIFYYDGEKVNFYHQLKDFNFFKEVITEKILNEPELFKKLNKSFQADIQELKDLVKIISLADIEKISELIGKIMSFYMFIVSDSFVARQPDAWESRHLSEGILYLVDEKIELLVSELLVKKDYNKTLAHYLNVEEIVLLAKNKQLLNLDLIRSRSQGYILYNDSFFLDLSFSEFCSKYEFINPENEIISVDSNIIKGDVASQGLAKGKVRIIINKTDLKKITAGDIMVSIMTNATFTSVLDKVQGIITDEGGVTCHAAIISRELKIPCIIGTKISTKVLKDGDLVEVNANEGIVKILR